MTWNRGRCAGIIALAVIAVTVSVDAQSFSVLYNFATNPSDPNQPYYAGVIAQGPDGNLYSTTATGGANNGEGAMFKITPRGSLTVANNFDNTDAFPQSGLTLGSDGNFYGASANGGNGNGTVFKVTPNGGLTILHIFSGSDGSLPLAPPIEGWDGNFYGTTYLGGTINAGVIYKVTPAGAFTMLHSFVVSDGADPTAALVEGTDGNFYGTTAAGGPGNNGVVFRMTPSTPPNFRVLYYFDYTHGAAPYSPLIQGSDGNFYGTASTGGTSNYGVIFKITASGVTVLHNINGTTDGLAPYAGLVLATDGNFYGVNSSGGTNNVGTIFSISPISPYTYKVLYNFTSTSGAFGYVTLIQHTNGNLYGDTNQGGTGSAPPPNGCSVGLCGVFFRFTVPGLTPFAGLVTPAARVGKIIAILGQGFSGTTGVFFNGTPTSWTVRGNNVLTATVPAGATSGFVTVATPGGTLTSNRTFQVLP